MSCGEIHHKTVLTSGTVVKRLARRCTQWGRNPERMVAAMSIAAQKKDKVQAIKEARLGRKESVDSGRRRTLYCCDSLKVHSWRSSVAASGMEIFSW